MGGLFRIIDSSRHHNFVFSSLEEANNCTQFEINPKTGNRISVKAIIYPPGK